MVPAEPPMGPGGDAAHARRDPAAPASAPAKGERYFQRVTRSCWSEKVPGLGTRVNVHHGTGLRE